MKILKEKIYFRKWNDFRVDLWVVSVLSVSQFLVFGLCNKFFISIAREEGIKGFIGLGEIGFWIGCKLFQVHFYQYFIEWDKETMEVKWL